MTTSKLEKMNTIDTMMDRSIPEIEHASHPMTLVLYDKSLHKDLSSSPNENMLLSSLFPSRLFPIRSILKYNLTVIFEYKKKDGHAQADRRD